MTEIAIVGTGPAGVRAAEILVQAGLRPTVVDEGPDSGGQVYRRPPEPLRLEPRSLHGYDAGRAVALHETFDSLRPHIDHLPATLVWSASSGELELLTGSRRRRLRWDRLILATGAMDRIIPFEGWTLPGVYTLGGAQVALKHQACTVGSRPIFLGTGPLLYLVAWQYAAAGVQPAAVLDTAPPAARRRSLLGLMRGGRNFAKGVRLVVGLRARGVALATGVRPLAAIGGPDGTVRELVWRDPRGALRRTGCDAVAVGFGLSSETRLADLCGLPFAFHAGQRQWLPICDEQGRSAAPGVYLAGDGAGIDGAAAAELSGARAAHALLHDLGHAGSGKTASALGHRLSSLARFREVLDSKAFPFPAALATAAADELVICRCEGVTAGVLRDAAQRLGASEINRAKAFTRIGMGPCQGRVCGPAAAEILAAALGVPLEAIGRLRGQAPVKPVPLAAFLEEAGL